MIDLRSIFTHMEIAVISGKAAEHILELQAAQAFVDYLAFFTISRRLA